MFTKFKEAVTTQFNGMVKGELFRTGVTGDEMWEHYLKSYPEGSNPFFRAKTEHECSCCRSFVKLMGNVVTVKDGKRVSIWDSKVKGEPAYQAVADSMAEFVKSKPIVDGFLHYDRNAGTDKNREQMPDGEVRTWNHFHVEIPLRNSGKVYVVPKDSIDSTLGKYKTTHDVFLRGLTELTVDSFDTVLEMIASNSLYRGEQNKAVVEAFLKVKKQFDGLPPEQQDDFVWSNIDKVGEGIARMKNTSFGELLSNISSGMDLEVAVKKYETMVAPENYQRTTSLVTKSMIENAKKKVAELGLDDALHRAYATLESVPLEHTIFVDRSVKKKLGKDVWDSLDTKAAPPKNLSKVEEISIDKFLKDVVTRAETIEIFVENKHVNNLVSLIGPADQGGHRLFKWGNDFSWSYNGDVTDSIKERVKKAGGSVTGDLCCRLAWFNTDDLDLHMKEHGVAGSRRVAHYELFFGNRGSASPSGGKLDVDMNAFGVLKTDAVENIYYARRAAMKETTYELFVNQYRKRETNNVGFQVEFDWMGSVKTFTYPKAVRQGENVGVVKFEYTHKDGVKILESLPSTESTRTEWNLKTGDFHRVNVLMESPNYWDERVGNRHTFFMLEGCRNDGKARGIYNEFLRDDLLPHRKVIEMVGAKMKTEESDNQLSGLGFSSTQRAEVLARVTGSITRTLKVVF